MTFASEREQLVHQLRRGGIRDERVLAAIEAVPRERFVDPQRRGEAYVDEAMPIGAGQTISQPYVVARMTELLEPRETDHVLDVGGGSGYQAAVLSRLVRDVVSVELRAELAAAAAERLGELGYHNVRLVQGDASGGYPTEAPYDKILIAAATPRIAEALLAQCAPGGRIVAPVGTRDEQRLIVRFADGRVERHDPVRFVPLLGEDGFSEH